MSRESNRITDEEQALSRTEDPDVRNCLICPQQYRRRIGKEGPASFAVRKYCGGSCAQKAKRQQYAEMTECRKGHPRDKYGKRVGRNRWVCTICKSRTDKANKKPYKPVPKTMTTDTIPQAPREERPPWRPQGWSRYPMLRGEELLPIGSSADTTTTKPR